MSSTPTLLTTPNYTQIISQALDYRENQISVVLELTAEGATVPFIARYRKERTGNLDETDIRAIIELQTKEENLYKAKQTAINGIEELGKMTPELLANIIAAKTLKEVEELYKPYKSKKKTKAMIAIEKGFQVVADSIKKNVLAIPEKLLAEFPQEEIIEGAIEIIASEVSANANLRHSLIAELHKTGDISSSKKSDKMLEKLNQKDTEQIPKFALYFEFNCRLSRIKPYQILALNRGENLGILNVKLEKDEMIFGSIHAVYRNILNTPHPNPLLKGEGTKSEKNLPSPSRRRVGDEVGHFIPELESAFKLGYDALWSSVENEVRGELSELGEDDSIKTFQTNLQALLMTRPEYGKTILAIDPGYRAGCKMCIIDPLGNPIAFDKIFLHEMENARAKLADIFNTPHPSPLLKGEGTKSEKNLPSPSRRRVGDEVKIDTVVVGNGTGCDETCTLVAELFSGDIFVVNESGASVYSASPIAQEEFPDLDSLDRGTVSIGRRYIDPLSELVKVPVGSIGVGMYQHDIAEKKLDEKLGYVVEDVVNEVGISVNNASMYVLNHISWIDKREAKKIYNHRPYKSREALKKVLSEKAYALAIGFLRVPESKEPLDNTDIHPDQYPLAKYILENWVHENNFSEFEIELKKLYPDVNSDTIAFILRAHSELGIEKRTSSTHTKARKKVAMEDVKEGDIFDGVIRNVVAFGAFVDIGLKNDGLVHVSQMADRFVSNPNDLVSVGDRVKVRITGIDLKTGKIQLSMKEI